MKTYVRRYFPGLRLCPAPPALLRLAFDAAVSPPYDILVDHAIDRYGATGSWLELLKGRLVNWAAVGAIAEMLGAIAVVASLLYLAVQIRQSTRQSRLAAQQAIVHELGRALQAQAQNR